MEENQTGLILQLHALVERVRGAPSEFALAALLDEMSAALSADYWVYVTFARNDASFESHRFLAGCFPALCQEYFRHKWYLNDPYLLYASRNNDPVIASTVKPQTKGQEALLRAGERFGFVDGFIVPAHAAVQVRVGALYVAYSDPARMNHETYTACRTLLRALSAELLDWVCTGIRKELIDRCGLQPDELELLRYQREGFTTRNIAALGIGTEHTINHRFGRIIHKLGASNRAEAAALAHENGLI